MSIPIGTMLFAPGTALPADWSPDPAPRADGWSSVAQSTTPLLREQRLAASGWTFAFRAPALVRPTGQALRTWIILGRAPHAPAT